MRYRLNLVTLLKDHDTDRIVISKRVTYVQRELYTIDGFIETAFISVSKDNLLHTVHKIFRYSDEVYTVTW